MTTTLVLLVCLSAAFLTGQSAVIAGNYEKLLASIHDITLPESDGTSLPVSYVNGKRKTYTRAVVDGFAETLVGVYKSIMNAFGFDISYKTSSGTEVEMRGVIMNKGTDKEELVVVGAYSYVVGDTIVTNMYTSDKDGYKSHILFRNKATVNPQVISSLLAG